MCCLLIVFAVATRLVPHPVNVTPIGAVGLFSGAYLATRRAWLIPVIALLLSDLIIGFYEPLTMLFVYSGFVFSALIGRLLLQKHQTFMRIGSAAVLSASLFFVLSNFGTWLSGTLYSMTFAGLIECYIAAIPFYGNTLAGDVVYSFALFGLYFLLQQTVMNQNTSTA